MLKNKNKQPLHPNKCYQCLWTTFKRF